MAAFSSAAAALTASPAAAESAREYYVAHVTQTKAPSQLSRGEREHYRAVFDAIDAAQRKLVDAVVTAPIAKESWKLAPSSASGSKAMT